ncbi:hypothetical protein CBL_20932 [Carabus blaptoides fortunei]
MLTNLRAPCELTEKLLPEFDPARMTGLSTTQWIQSVDRSDSFKQELLRSFPSVSDQADIHLQLTKRRRERGESSETYIYSMKAIAKKGQVEISSLIKYILNGLGDRELVRALSLCEFVVIEDLLLKIKRYESLQDRAKFGTQMRSNDYLAENSRRERSGTKGLPASDQRDKKMWCYNCQETGHLARDCVKPTKPKSCFNCGGTNHVLKNCQQERKKPDANVSSSPKTTIRKVEAEEFEPSDEYHKWVEIHRKKIIGHIDLGSDVVTLKAEMAEQANIRYQKEIGEVELETKVLIVPNEAQTEAVLIRQSALDRPDIRIIKEKGLLTITRIPTENEENADEMQVKRIVEHEGIQHEDVKRLEQLTGLDFTYN